jgi:hypothetical protein
MSVARHCQISVFVLYGSPIATGCVQVVLMWCIACSGCVWQDCHWRTITVIQSIVAGVAADHDLDYHSTPDV